MVGDLIIRSETHGKCSIRWEYSALYIRESPCCPVDGRCILMGYPRLVQFSAAMITVDQQVCFQKCFYSFTQHWWRDAIPIERHISRIHSSLCPRMASVEWYRFNIVARTFRLSLWIIGNVNLCTYSLSSSFNMSNLSVDFLREIINNFSCHWCMLNHSYAAKYNGTEGDNWWCSWSWKTQIWDNFEMSVHGITSNIHIRIGWMWKHSSGDLCDICYLMSYQTLHYLTLSVV